LIVGSLAVSMGLWFAACGSSSNQATSSNSGDGGNATGGGANAGGAGGSSMSGPTGMGGNIIVNPTSSGGNGAGGAPDCAGQTSTAELVPLDIYIMLDKSGSMTEKTGAGANGPPKWDAVTQALNAFFNDA